MYTGIDLRTIKFLDPSLLQHKLKELFQTGEANMYLMLCAINHSQHIHLSKTEPQLSLSLSLSLNYITRTRLSKKYHSYHNSSCTTSTSKKTWFGLDHHHNTWLNQLHKYQKSFASREQDILEGRTLDWLSWAVPGSRNSMPIAKGRSDQWWWTSSIATNFVNC